MRTPRTREIINPNNKNVKIKPGDVVFIYNGTRVPKYAKFQFAVVLERFKVMSKKYQEFFDYGSKLIMLTGTKKGHIVDLLNVKLLPKL